MKAKAMYIGKREIDLPERTNKDGVHLNAMKGTYLSFYQNRWKNGVLQETGKFYNMFFEHGKEVPELERGSVHDIYITSIDPARCTIWGTNEESDDD